MSVIRMIPHLLIIIPPFFLFCLLSQYSFTHAQCKKQANRNANKNSFNMILRLRIRWHSWYAKILLKMRKIFGFSNLFCTWSHQKFKYRYFQLFCILNIYKLELPLRLIFSSSGLWFIWIHFIWISYSFSDKQEYFSHLLLISVNEG